MPISPRLSRLGRIGLAFSCLTSLSLLACHRAGLNDDLATVQDAEGSVQRSTRLPDGNVLVACTDGRVDRVTPAEFDAKAYCADTPLPKVLAPVTCRGKTEPRSIGIKGGRYCSFGGVVEGPFPAEMVDVCLREGTLAREACESNSWPEASFVKLYRDVSGQDELCPRGSSLDEKSGYCFTTFVGQDNERAFGPFDDGFTAKCAELNGGNPCDSARWDREHTLASQEAFFAGRFRGESVVHVHSLTSPSVDVRKVPNGEVRLSTLANGTAVTIKRFVGMWAEIDFRNRLKDFVDDAVRDNVTGWI